MAAVRCLRFAILATLVIGAIGACGRRSSSPRVPPAEIRVAAASSFGGTLEALGAAFEREGGSHVVPIFGATGALAQQIEQGLPVDVFLSADSETPARLALQGVLVADTVAPFARGILVLYAPADASVRVTTLAQLRAPGVQRIALANPDHAPFGRAAREVLTRAGLWDSLTPRLVMAENVREAFEFARTGNADVAFTARSVTIGAAGSATPLDPSLYAPLDESLGVMEDSSHPREARAFARFVHSASARAILTAHGFEPRP